MTEKEDDAAPGWDAIDAALAELYGDREPDRHYGTILRWSLGGDQPLDGLSAYKVLEPRPHWHIVSFGMTELYLKESDDPDTSGFGFEFTMRVACEPDDEEPPTWALNFLQNIGRYVFDTGNVFADGHHMNINGPICVDSDTKIRAIAFCNAPELPTKIDGPFGSFGFLHVVGLTLDELEGTQRWNTEGILDLLRRSNPLLLTDLSRDSVLDDPELAELYAEGRARDGSSQGALHISRLEYVEHESELHVTIGALAVRGLVQLMEGRIRLGRDAWLFGGETCIGLVPGDTFGYEHDDEGDLVLVLPETAARALQTLPIERGDYTWPELPGLRLTVEPSEIKDPDGNVLETIG